MVQARQSEVLIQVDELTWHDGLVVARQCRQLEAKTKWTEQEK